MARKIVNFTVTGEGRDKGKLFLLTEMTASKGEAWATRVLLALMASNVNLPENFADLGMAALAELGIRALSGLKWEVAAPLLAEMFDCIEIIPDPKKTHIHRVLIEEDVEEIQTRVILRMEVWKLHMGFLMAVIPSLERTVKKAATKG
jgi:hypothetical protein